MSEWMTHTHRWSSGAQDDRPDVSTRVFSRTLGTQGVWVGEGGLGGLFYFYFECLMY